MKTLIKKWGLSVVSIMISGLIIFALLLFFNINTKSTLEKFIHSHLSEMNHAAVIAFNQNFKNFIALLEQEVAILGLMKNPTDEEILSTLKDFAKKNEFKNVAIITYDGTAYSSYRGIAKVQPNDKLPNLNKKATTISQPRIFWDNTLVIDISTSVYIDGKHIGKLVITIDSSAIAAMFNNSILQGNASLSLVSKEGTVIAKISEPKSRLAINTNLFDFYNDEAVKFIISSPQSLRDNFAANKSGNLKYSYDDNKICALYEPLGINNWHLLISASDSTLNAETTQLERLALILTIGILIVVIITVLIIASHHKKEQERVARLKNTYSIAIKKTNDLFYETDIESDLFINHTENTEKQIWKETPKNYSNALSQGAEVCSPEYRQPFLDAFLPQNIKLKMEEGQSSINFEYKVNLDENTERWLSATIVPVVDSIDHSTKLICMENDITEQKLKQENLQRRAIFDDLTGLYNKATTMQSSIYYFENDVANRKIAVMVIDIDYFKSVNDNLGHSKGDEVLSQFGHELKKIFRTNDIVGRIGGDEFIVVLKDYGTIDLVKGKADEVRNSIRKEHFDLPDKSKTVKTTASIGIALYDKDGEDFNELFKKADIALYISKNRGRDQYTFFDNSMKKS